MKVEAVLKVTAAAALGLTLAACGGGGGGGSSSTPSTQSSLQVSGTAATGAALASASVEVKCATGSGTATTSSAGAYTVTMVGGALPCLVRVTGTSAGGAAVTLHSAVEAGTSGTGGTNAVANVTPITEMIVAQLLEKMPADAFASFDPAAVTQAALTTATTAIVDALKTAGVDLGSIDPLKGSLVPPSGSTAGNTYDQMLDKLALTVSTESLPLLVNQIATSAASDSTTGLGTVVTAVASGSLANCPQAISGKYRTIDYTGGAQVHTVDFKAMTWTTEGESAQPITAAAQACQFSVGNAVVTVGPQGAGAFREADMVGFVFPLQAHTLAAVTGEWKAVESGLNESNAGEHWFTRYTFNADGTAKACDHEVMSGVANFNPTCTPDSETVSIRAASDGSFDMLYGAVPAKLWGYKGPNGVVSLFGSTNPAGTNGAGTLRTHIVMVKPLPLPVQAVGTVSKYWDIVLNFNGTSFTSPALGADTLTYIALDEATGTVTRKRESDGRVDSLRQNYPTEGIRYRAVTSTISAVYGVQVPDLGVQLAFDDMPNSHFYSITVVRP